VDTRNSRRFSFRMHQRLSPMARVQRHFKREEQNRRIWLDAPARWVET
jgi:hypothetical protein